jgi:hypothetical protein
LPFSQAGGPHFACSIPRLIPLHDVRDVQDWRQPFCDHGQLPLFEIPGGPSGLRSLPRQILDRAEVDAQVGAESDGVRVDVNWNQILAFCQRLYTDVPNRGAELTHDPDETAAPRRSWGPGGAEAMGTGIGSTRRPSRAADYDMPDGTGKHLFA